MTIVVEYRIPMPFTMEEYAVGQLYMIAQASMAESKPGEGVSFVKNEPIDPNDSQKGWYTRKIFHVGNSPQIPKFIRAIIKNAVNVVENSWNSWPHYRTEYHSPLFGSNFKYTIESYHVADKAESDANDLPIQIKDKYKKKKKVVVLDIATSDPAAMADCNPLTHSCEKSGMPPLTEDWLETQPADRVMTAYKVVTVHCNIFGVGHRIEQFVQRLTAELFVQYHRKIFVWHDSWFDKTMEDIHELESLAQQKLAVSQSMEVV
ncbi:phosphatidylinositol transfer protein [Carpediemonas membranifera]|uniref:Phosphatidylinositol transfer protein n=1 Tax=Carpediemonas membranifera TaxID=201153 RepID=A0A8J6B121_9EUKA|nr:phosphatidylinositol transfer protein [Carpediemonas membranifera]|eukprot:KAG9397010.1 phosphatidylinositol transfer protein [Carpediemonas membranifera]